MVYAASVDLNDRNYMYCLKESRFITSELVGIKWQKVHFINFIQREVTVTHFKTGPLMRFFVPESNQDREIIFALWFTTCRRCSTSQTFQKSINVMKKALFYVPITLKKKNKACKGLLLKIGAIMMLKFSMWILFSFELRSSNESTYMQNTHALFFLP